MNLRNQVTFLLSVTCATQEALPCVVSPHHLSHTTGSQPLPSPRSSPFPITCLVALAVLFPCKASFHPTPTLSPRPNSNATTSVISHSPSLYDFIPPPTILHQTVNASPSFPPDHRLPERRGSLVCCAAPNAACMVRWVAGKPMES